MARFFAGAAAAFLLLTGIILIWQGRAEEPPLLPPAPAAPVTAPTLVKPAVLKAPEATPKSREEKRFSRADRNDNGRIELEDLLGRRRTRFGNLDVDGNGILSFEEWAVTTIEKFEKADADRSRWLSPAEYATTAPKRKPKKKPKCKC